MTRRLLLVTAAVVAVLFGVFWFLAWSPASSHLAAARTSVGLETQQQVILNGQLVSLRAQDQYLGSLKSALANLEGAVPASASLDTAIDALTKAGARSGVTVPTIGASQPAASPSSGSPTTTGAGSIPVASGPASITLTLAFDGTYQQIVAFSNLLASAPRLFVVESLNLGRSGGNGLNGSMTLKMFYQSPTSGGGS